MKELIKSVSEDLTKSIISETFLDTKILQIKIESSLKILLSKSIRPESVCVKFLEDKMAKKNKQAHRDSIERDFWKNIAKTYIGEENIMCYYERLNFILKSKDLI